MSLMNQTMPTSESRLPVEHDDLAHTSNDNSDLEDDSSIRRIGPGLPESFLWLGAFGILQVVLGVVSLVITIVLTSESMGDFKQFDISKLSSTIVLTTIAAPALVTYFILIPLGLWRMSPQPLTKLNINLPPVGRTLIAMSLVIPLTIVADSIFRVFEPVWISFSSQIPMLQSVNGTDVHSLLGDLSDASLPLTLFFIAVVPAIGEEFLFRGLLGRGLVHRWGLFVGVLITSFLFAAVHIYPPHVVAIIPVGVALHIIYLTTNSIWAPVLFHFVNNSIAALAIRFADDAETPASVPLIIGAIAYSVMGLIWLAYLKQRADNRIAY